MEVPRPTYFNVPKNEAQVLDLSPGADTPERKLKDLLLSDDEAAKVSAAVGMGGIGKTTDMCALGHDRQVWMKYHDGIWFIQLGQDITVEDLRVELNMLVDKVCSREFTTRFSKLLTHKRGFGMAIQELVEELKKIDFLLIFDDVWKENEAYSIVKQIASAVSASSGCLKMLISTRTKGVARCPLTNAVVHVGPKDPQGTIARRILSVHSQTKFESLPGRSTRAGKAVETILDRCAGLPLALAVAGSTAHAYMEVSEDNEDHEHHTMWLQFRDSLRTNAVRLGKNGSNQHEDGLFSCVDASMILIEKKFSGNHKETARKLLSSLCIFPKRTWIAMRTLKRTWGTKPGYAESFVEILADYNIVSHDIWKGLRAHDLVLDYCAELARQDGTNTDWHKRILQGYSCELDRVEGEEVSCVNWWSEKLSTDNYIRLNVVRHLLGCDKVSEAVRLVCDYRWVQLLNRDESHLPFQQSMSDLKKIKEYISTNTTEGRELMWGVRLLLETMELCAFACFQNRSEYSFQLYGRLTSLEYAPKLFARCLWSIERYGTGLWAKPSPGVLRGAGGSLKRVVPVQFDVWSMEVGVEGDELALGGDDGEVAMMTLRGGTPPLETNSYVGYGEEVISLEIDERTGDVFSISGYMTVAVHRAGELEHELCPFGADTGKWVTCIKLLIDPKLIAFGSNEGIITLMDMEKGHIVWTMNGHTDYISSLEAVKGGEILISASYDRTVRQWDKRSGRPIGEPLRGHTRVVNCLALSACGKLIASGSCDETVRLWDASKGIEVCSAMSAHDSMVQSVLFNHKGDVLFSGGFNEIIVWDVRAPLSGVFKKQKLSHDMSWVTALRLSRDGEELFAASKWKHNVFVWRAETPWNWHDSTAQQDSFLSGITVFGISPDGEIMATRSRRSHDRINIRKVCDVSANVDKVLLSCRAVVEFVHQIAVTNDMQLIAYCGGWRGTKVYVSRASTGEVVHEFTKLFDWMRSLGGPDYDGAISSILFDPQGNNIWAEARAWRSSDGNWVSKSMRWSTSTGRPCSVENSTSNIAIESQTSWQGSPSKSSPPHLVMKIFAGVKYPLGNEVLIADGPKTLTGGTLEVTPLCSHYEHTTQRLWITNEDNKLQFIDLINGPRSNLGTEPPSIPLFLRSPPPQVFCMGPPLPPYSHFTVFISYSGPDKPLADWLYARLTEMGISVFAAKKNILRGQDYAKVMNDAMEHADIAIIIVSPEYPAKKWTMRELMCFQRRAREAEQRGEMGPTIIPLYFRMGPGGCKRSEIMNMRTEDGQYVLYRYNFFDRLDELKLDVMLDSMQCLRRLQGIENVKRISNKARKGQSQEEWMEELGELLEEVVIEVLRVLKKFGKGVVYTAAAGSSVRF